MKCARCNRAMLRLAATVATRDAAQHYGPKCAAAMGILPSKAGAPARRTRPAKAMHDELQTDWVDQEC